MVSTSSVKEWTSLQYVCMDIIFLPTEVIISFRRKAIIIIIIIITGVKNIKYI